MRRRFSVGFAVTIAAVVVLGSGCRSAGVEPGQAAETWDVSRAETLTWHPDDENFTQDRALETSGLAFTDTEMVAPSEKYGRLLFFDKELNARVVTLGVPRHAELEGVAWHDGSLFLCDEAHAAVYRVDLGEGAELLPRMAAVGMKIEGIDVVGGKIGFEGIEVSPDGRYLSVLLERSGDPENGCVSRIWQGRLDGDRLIAEDAAVDIALEDCNWRITGLAWDGTRLLGLKTQYPGSRYHIVEFIGAGETALVQDLTDYLRGVRADGWGNNVEGIAVADDGALWLIGDNRVSGVIDDPHPPLTDEKALLLRIPRRSD